MREPGRRVFSREYNESNLEIKEGDSRYAPKYIVTPTGAKCNRLFIIGVVTNIENIADDGEYYRATVSDPTGEYYLYSGEYQPEATRTLANTEPPEYVAISAKTDTYENDDGAVIATLRPETVTVVSRAERDMWILTTAQRTLERLEQADEVPEVAMENYGEVDVGKYASMVREGLSPLTGEDIKPNQEEKAQHTVTASEGQSNDEELDGGDLEEESETWDFS